MAEMRRALTRDFSLRSAVIAVGLILTALAGREILHQWLPRLPPFITLYPAVAVAGLVCGPLAGALGCLIGVAGATFLWIPPRFSLTLPNVTDCVAIGLFLGNSAIVLLVAGSLRAQRDAARLAKAALELGLESGGVGTWEIDLQTRRITASDTAYRLHNLPAGTEATTAEDWLRGVPASDLAAAREGLLHAVETGASTSYSYRVLGGPDGPTCIRARGQVVGSLRDRRLLCALVDITDQVRVQDALRRERERLRLALAAGALAVWDYDPVARDAIIDARYAVTMGFGSETDRLSRTTIGDRIHPEDRARVAAEHEALAASGAAYAIEFRILTDTGEVRWVVSQGIALRDGDSASPSRIVGIIQDITDRKLREAALQDLASIREVLIREADHRIKNSLQLVTSLLGVQLRGVNDPEAADALRGAMTRVGAIATSHLALQGSEDLRQVDVAVTLRELCAQLGQLHPSVGITCLPCPVLLLDADRAIPLGLAVSEVITNALRHAFPGRAGGTVVVGAAVEDGTVVIRVTDDGVGMKAEGGAGLGSRIIQSLVGRIGATVGVESEAGKGTVVTLRVGK
jgi:PAS domain S-box-containing protein